MNAKIKLAKFKEKLEVELSNYLKIKTKESYKISPYCGELMDHISEITMRGGKRIRAAILYFSYLAHGGKDKKRALKAAVSMELMQSFLLIHDDIIDNDSLRRGGLTIHKTYENIGEERYHDKSNLRTFGTSTAIMAGDIACALSNEIIADSGFACRDVQRALLELNKMYLKEYFGEFLDILSELRDDIAQKDVILTHQLKTVPYTFDGPIKIGAMLAGARDKDIANLDGYTVPLGTAFQIQDDILGMFGSEEKLGKPNTSDLREGKRTLLILDALKKANEEQKNIINLNLGNKRVNTAGLKSVRKVIEDTGALKKSIKLAEKYVDEAIESISKNKKLTGEGREFLISIADYMVKRDY